MNRTDTTCTTSPVPPVDTPPNFIPHYTLEEGEARRQTAIWGIGGGILAQLFFVVYNGIGSSFTDTLPDISSTFLFVVALIMLLRTNMVKAAYRLGIFTVVYIYAYTMLFPLHQTSAVIQVFFAAPIILFYTLGIREGFFWLIGMLAPALICQLHPSLFQCDTLSPTLRVSFWASIGTTSALAAASEWLRQKTWQTYTDAHNAFQSATKQLKQLEGLVPICSYCKSIRDDKGFWRKLETYLTQNTSAHISSGVCEKCAKDNQSLKQTSSFPVPAQIAKLSTWRETVDTTKRKIIQYLVLALGIPVMWTFILRDYWGGDVIGSISQALASVVLLAVALCIWKAKNVGLVYHLVVLVLFAYLILPFFSPVPDGTAHLWFFLFPLAAGLVLSFRATFVWTLVLLGFSTVIFTVPYFADQLSNSTENFLFFVTIYIIMGFFTLSLKRIRSHSIARATRQMEDLENTYDSIKTLKGLVPVCSSCKSIRNDNGFWERIDTYLLDRTDLRLTHSICNSCLQREMPEIYDEMKQNGEL